RTVFLFFFGFGKLGVRLLIAELFAFFVHNGNEQVRTFAESCCVSVGHAYPTDPSICNSMSLFSSNAYSIGRCREIGSTIPRTIIALASSSESPRLIWSQRCISETRDTVASCPSVTPSARISIYG